MAKKSGPALPEPVPIPEETLLTIRRITMALVAFGLFAAVTLGQPIRAVVFERNGINLPIANTSVSFGGFLAVGPLVMLAIWGYLQINLRNVWQKPVPPDPPSWRVLGLYDRPIPALMGWLAQTALLQVLLFGFAFKATIFPWGSWSLVAAIGGSILVARIAVHRRWPDPPRPWLGRGWRTKFMRRASLAVELILLPGCLLAFGPLLELDRVDLSHGKLERVNFRNFHLRGAVFTGADLRNASLGGADLRETVMGEAILTGADLRGADLSEANLHEANLEKANLEKTNLRKAKLQRANLRGANLIEANLQGANLQGVNLEEAVLEKANLGKANLQRAILNRANLIEAFLEKANLFEAELRGANLFEANLAGVFLKKANLQEARIGLANLQKAVLFDANLQGVDLQGANLKKADLLKADLQGADLRQADLREAFLKEANLQGTDLKEANLRGASLFEAKNLTRGQICSAEFDKDTTFPDGTDEHTAQDVCAEGVPDDVFGLTPPGKKKSG